jgi:hypothetical protein
MLRNAFDSLKEPPRESAVFKSAPHLPAELS